MTVRKNLTSRKEIKGIVKRKFDEKVVERENNAAQCKHPKLFRSLNGFRTFWKKSFREIAENKWNFMAWEKLFLRLLRSPLRHFWLFFPAKIAWIEWTLIRNPSSTHFLRPLSFVEKYWNKLKNLFRSEKKCEAPLNSLLLNEQRNNFLIILFNNKHSMCIHKERLEREENWLEGRVDLGEKSLYSKMFENNGFEDSNFETMVSSHFLLDFHPFNTNLIFLIIALAPSKRRKRRSYLCRHVRGCEDSLLIYTHWSFYIPRHPSRSSIKRFHCEQSVIKIAICDPNAQRTQQNIWLFFRLRRVISCCCCRFTCLNRCERARSIAEDAFSSLDRSQNQIMKMLFSCIGRAWREVLSF